MSDESTYLIRLAAWLARGLGDSAALFAEFSTDHLGLELPGAVLEAAPVVSTLRQAGLAANHVGQAGADLERVAASGEELEILARFVELGAALGEYYAALDGLVGAVHGSITPATIPDAAARAAAEAFAGDLAKRVGDYALASIITMQLPELAYLLTLAGLLEWQYLASAAGDGLSRDYVRRALALDRLKDMISDPERHFRESLGWGAADFDPGRFFRLTRDFFGREDDVEVGVEAGEPFLRIGSFLIRRDAAASPPGLVLSFMGSLDVDKEAHTELDHDWGLGIHSNFRLSGSASGLLTPPLEFRLLPATGEITGELRAFFDRNESARPFDVVGGTGGLLVVSINNLTAGVGLQADWNIADGSASIDPLLFANIDGLTLRLGTSDGDSFIGSLLAAAEIQGEFDLGLEWRASIGLRVTASGGIEIALPIHRQLGPIELQTLYLALRILDDGTLSLEISTQLDGLLGPLVATVERMGVKFDLRFAAGTDARYGPFDLDLSFKPPNGVGIAIDTPAVTGGGYLYFDFDREEYAGVLQLSIADLVTVTAIGLITTRMPDGSQGFSMLIIITAEFGSGIQLGFGFTLSGVGGLLGLNRTMRLEVLAQGVRSGSLRNVMFPHDVIANAPRIISDLKSFFPPEQGKFLIGPMAKLGWGTPTLVSITLGVIIEIPGNIAIVGALRVALPTDDEALLVLQVSFIGAIEFDKKRIWFFASLFDSRVLFITLDGEMGLLVAFGEDANFVVTVGGFHPQFTPPPLPFPGDVHRISLSILNEDWARIRVTAYFAVTSNTAQFGAHAELFFGFDAINIQGQIGFDALFQFSPFYFIVQISASVSLTVFGLGLFGISLSLSLEGPTPWRARGTGSISILFITVSASFDVTWGEARDTTLPPIQVMPLLKAEFDKTGNWQAILPDGSNLLVSLRTLAESETHDVLILHPVGTLRVTQKYAPLDLTLDKIGNQQPSDAKLFKLNVAGGPLDKLADQQELFALAQFENMDDAAKLSHPAYEPQHSGLELSVRGEQLASGKMTRRVVRYEEIILDSNYKRFVRHFQAFAGVLFSHFLKGGSVSKSKLSKHHKSGLQPFEDKVKVQPDAYAVASRMDNTVRERQAVFTSSASAYQYMQQQIARDPRLADALHVIPSCEVNPLP